MKHADILCVVCARLLLDHGADPDFRQRGQNTSLLLAAVRGNDSMCRLLLGKYIIYIY